ncbi:hypothetical protein HYU19_00665 [Candidatus Woesearchaeota archaeon]|nr:hypothetical protein [Candidatus Woesearchaeota archaeon]
MASAPDTASEYIPEYVPGHVQQGCRGGFFASAGTVLLTRHWHKYAIAFGAVILLLAVLATKNLLFLSLLLSMNMLLSALLRPFKRFLGGFASGIELVTLSTVLAGMAYGSWIGALFGMASLAVNFFFLGRMTMFTLLVLPAYGLIGLLAPLVTAANVTMAGIFFSIAYNSLVSIAILSFFRGSMLKCLAFSSTNIVFNVLAFTYLAPFMARLMV